MEVASMPEAIQEVIEAMPEGHCFFGNELHDAVVKIYPAARDTYVSSILQAMRRKCGQIVRCINPSESLYQKLAYNIGGINERTCTKKMDNDNTCR